MNKEMLVIGGGIAGIQSSLHLAEMGFKVHLVERLPSIGGKMAQLDKTFPTNDCAIWILSPKMLDVDRHPNVELMAYSEVEKIEGERGNFKVTVRKKARYVEEDKCTGCGACTEMCFCNECTLESEDLISKGELPVDIPVFHLVRAMHMADKCIDCCLCEQACPVDIPLRTFI